MGTGNPPGASREAPDPATEDATLPGDDEWRVAEQYRTEPVPQGPASGDAAIVLEQDGAPPPRRRFPPEVGPGVAAALVGVLLALLLVPAGFWLASEAGADDPAGETRTFDTGIEQPPAVAAERTVPDLVGRSLEEARESLANADLRLRVRRVASDEPRDSVVAQEPRPGAEVDVRAVVVLSVSEGAQTVAVPEVEGMSVDEASEALGGAGLEAETQRVPSDEAEGTVVAQEPGAGEEVEPGSTVVLDVAEAREEPPPPTTEPATIRVPGLVGMRSSAARARLSGLGLRSTQRPVRSSRPAGEVVGQSPAAGAELREGGVVTLRVSTGPATVAVPDVVGMAESDAIRNLEAAGFAVRVVDGVAIEPADEGLVLDQSPPGGADARKGATVTITVARLTG